MAASFNLLDEPWLPCAMLDGSAAELSLTDALLHAHEIRELFDESPLVTVALHRLLLAILHRNFGPAGVPEWFALWRRARWDETKLTPYFSRWRERFDLFHPKHPFYQVPEIENAGRLTAATLFQELSAGNNPTLFDHTNETAPPRFSPAQAARGLVARQAFSVGFGKSKPFYFSDSPLLRGFSVLVTGDNLFETLALNFVRYNEENPIPRASKREDLPVWEQEHRVQPRREGSTPAGYLDYLTWQSRRIHLYPESESSAVQWCQLQQGLKLGDTAPLDPFKCYRKDKKLGFIPMAFREERALWRDSHALFLTDESHQRPAVSNWIAQLASAPHVKSAGIRRAYSFAAFGLATGEGKAASVTLWRHERLPLPVEYLENSDLLADLKRALDDAENAGTTLRQCAWLLARALLTPPGAAGPQPRQDEIEPVARGLAPERRFWPALETPFLNLMTKLPCADASAREDERLRWRKETVRPAAHKAFGAIVRDLDSGARELIAVALAERAFRRKLREGLESEETS